MIRTVMAALLASACLHAAPALAAESYDNCTSFVTSLPATISTQGTWCLNKDLVTSITSGAAITIAANNVTLDCNDFKLGGLAGGGFTRAIGIKSSEQSNVTVRHCNVRGFFNGVQVTSSLGTGHIVEDNRVENAWHIGIQVGGDASVVRGNRITSTGSASGLTDRIQAVGIWTLGAVDVIDNTIYEVAAMANVDSIAVGVYAWINQSGSITGNRISEISPSGSGGYGILLEGPTGYVSVEGNHLAGHNAQGTTGIACTAMNERAILARNVIGGWQVAQDGCAYDGGNTIFP